ncbi:MAG: ABC transporter substrate-binding protein [Clostridiales bacterium]|nr:ABC transporter substrate-binding protein [Clostridiales bacterium]
MSNQPRATLIKTLLRLTLIVFSLFIFAGCSEKNDAVIKIGMLKGPTGMGAVWLMEQNELGQTNNKYDFSALANSPDEISMKLLDGQLDIAAVPTNLAAILYNKTKGGILVAAVHTLGMLYILENGDTIHSVADLAGKEIFITGEGGVPQYAFEYILTANGLDPQNGLKITYVSEHAALAAQMTANVVVLGMLPEPNVTAVMENNKAVRIALNLTEEWRKVAGEEAGELAMGCLVVRKEFAEKNPQAFKAFLEEYENSIKYALNNTKEAAALCEKHGVIPNKDIAEKALPKCNITYIEGSEMIPIVKGFLTVLFNANAKSVGDKMPGDDFYYVK